MDLKELLENPRNRRLAMIASAGVVLIILVVLFKILGSGIGRASADLASTDRKARVDAVGDLVADGSNAAHGVLKIYVRDKDAIIAGMCIDAIGRFGWEEDLPLFDELLKEPREELRKASVVALGWGGRKKTDHDRIILVFKSDKSVGVRVEAAKILGRHYVWAAMPHLIKAMRDPSAQVRAAAYGAIERNFGTRYRQYNPLVKPENQEEAIKMIEKIWPDYKKAHDDYMILLDKLEADGKNMRS
jgi:HEAT repeat protein